MTKAGSPRHRSRHLVLLRHAQADDPPETADEDRPLSPGGVADARAAGDWLADRYPPEVVLCSPARRTRETWQAVAAALPTGAELVRYERRLYPGTVEDMLVVVRHVESTVSTVLMIGHNPAISRFASALPPPGGRPDEPLRTCGITVHTLDRPWSACAPAGAPIVGAHTARAPAGN